MDSDSGSNLLIYHLLLSSIGVLTNYLNYYLEWILAVSSYYLVNAEVDYCQAQLWKAEQRQLLGKQRITLCEYSALIVQSVVLCVQKAPGKSFKPCCSNFFFKTIYLFHMFSNRKECLHNQFFVEFEVSGSRTLFFEIHIDRTLTSHDPSRAYLYTLPRTGRRGLYIHWLWCAVFQRFACTRFLEVVSD